jgi:hypothetical protein
MNNNPLAGHPLLRRDVEAKPVIAEAMADSIIKETQEAAGLQHRLAEKYVGAPRQAPPIRDIAIVGADFGAVEARAIAAHKAGMLDDHGVPYGANLGGDGFKEPTKESLAAVQAEIEKVSKPDTFVVPHSMTDKDIDEISKKIAAKTGRPFNVVRGAMPEVIKQQFNFAAQAARDHLERTRSRSASQLFKALDIIRAAERPVKLGYIEQALGEPIFRTLEPALRDHPHVGVKRHKNTTYFTWKG